MLKPEYVGRVICGAVLIDNRLILTLDGPQKIAIWDDGQQCCESRWMTSDDNVTSLIGHKLIRVEIKQGPDSSDYDYSHQTAFVEVGTDKGFITLVTHNEHNGYYGGFGLTITDEGTQE
jgi:hypothetical protein